MPSQRGRMPLHAAMSVGLCLILAAFAGCAKPKSRSSVTEPVLVSVTEPIEKELADFAEFTGRTDAVESVEIRARVSGYLDKILFKPGKEVAAGEVLFEIDPRTYNADLDRNIGLLATSEASLKQAKADMARAENLREKKVSTQADYDNAVSTLSQAEAAVQSSQAAVATSKLSLSFTNVTAPIAGRTSRELITVGNLVAADTTALTTIVSLDPVYAYFDVDERTLLDIQQRIREKKMDSARDRDDVEVRLQLATETGFPHVGVIDLVDNRVDVSTGTMQIRGRFPNADRVLTPGLFVRIQFQMGPPRTRLLIPEKGLAQQQGQRYVYIVNSEKKVERRDVTVGRRDGSLRVIETGIKKSDRIIVQGQQRVRPGAEVKIEAPVAAVGETDPKSQTRPK